MKKNIKSLTLAAAFTAFLAVSAWVTIPVPFGVPLTLQTFGVALCGYCLPRRYSALSVAVYLLIGLFGVPVFSGFRGGIGILLASTGGFLLSFPVMAACCKLYNSKTKAFLSGITGMLLCHTAGVIQFSVVTKGSFFKSFLLVSLPFLIKDAASVFLAMITAARIKKTIDRGNK